MKCPSRIPVWDHLRELMWYGPPAGGRVFYEQVMELPTLEGIVTE
jgi:hypothetical protein